MQNKISLNTTARKSIINFALTSMGEFLFCILLLGLVGVMLVWKMDAMLNHSMENDAAKHADFVAGVVSDQFRRELDGLALESDLLSNGKVSLADLYNGGQQKGLQEGLGLADLTGRTIEGTPLSSDALGQIARSFRGERCVDALPNGQLLFTVPVYHGGRVQSVLYRLYDLGLVVETFGWNPDPAEKLMICHKKTGQMVIPYQGLEASDEVFDLQQSIPRGFGRLQKLLEQQRTASMYIERNNHRYFQFGAVVPNTDFIVLGYLPWTSMVGDIAHIHMLAVWVFGLLLLLFAVFSLYSFMAKVKNRESDELREAKAAADQANHAKSAFLANMSHEIRTPINAVLGMNEMILRESHEEGVRKYAWNIKSASETLLSLINDILDFSKIESGKMEIVIGEYQLSSVLNDVVNMIKIKAEQKKLAFHIQVDAELPEHLLGDEVRIKQVLVNIMNNAVKYTREGYVDFQVKGKVLREQEVELQFIVKDTGIGIRPEDKKKLFSDFERLDLQKNRHIEGTGLGLAITRNLVQQMQGKILVDSVYGEGSTFQILLPQKVVDTAQIGNFEERINEFIQNQKRHAQGFLAPQAKILVVDDNEMNLFVVESLLKKTQIQITRSPSGADCLKKLAKAHYDLVFLDHMMPGMDGIETLEKARAQHLCPNTPVVALTANAIAGVKEMFLQKGFTDYLSKPIDSLKLEKMLEKYLPAGLVIPVVEKQAEPKHQVKPASSSEELPAAKAKTVGHCIDTALGLHYNGGMKDLYQETLTMFCQMRPDMQDKMSALLAEENWKDYTTQTHALKSTSLSIGGRKLSVAAKKLEEAGHRYCAEDANENERQEAVSYIRENHPKVMKLYDDLVEEAKQKMKIDG